MQKFHLEILFRIIGIGSASGLIFNNNTIFLVSDNSNVLYEYKTEGQKLDKILLSEASPSENIPKKDKPDFEAIALKGDTVYLFGSGSTGKRNAMVPVNMSTKKPEAPVDLTDLYLGMQDFGGIKPEDFNIEAVVNDGDDWYFFNRGNGPKGRNGIFTITGNIKDSEYQMMYNDIKLPKINKAQSGFTDAIKVGNTIYFIAAAEKSGSTYLDGEVAGTLIGRLNIETMKVEKTKVISNTQKFEGITLYKETAKQLEFLLCEDKDSDAKESDIFKLIIDK